MKVYQHKSGAKLAILFLKFIPYTDILYFNRIPTKITVVSSSVEGFCNVKTLREGAPNLSKFWDSEKVDTDQKKHFYSKFTKP